MQLVIRLFRLLYFFKSCRCWTWCGSDTHRVFSTLITFSDPFQFGSISVSSNELTSRIESVRWGRQCWDAPEQFWKPFQRHVLNVTLIAYNILHACTILRHVALIAFLVTSCLNWPRHCMHVDYFALWYELIQATARAGFCVCLTRACHCSEAGAETSLDWCDRKDVLRLNKWTSCQE